MSANLSKSGQQVDLAGRFPAGNFRVSDKLSSEGD